MRSVSSLSSAARIAALQHHRRMASVTVLASSLALGAALARLASIEGWLRPAVISGASMAPTLVGPHLEVVCRGCAIPTPVVWTDSGLPPQFLCSNCGHRQQFAESPRIRPGVRVLIDRAAYQFTPPGRFDLVAVRDTETGGLRVKRLLGLPGERVEFRGGNLWVDGNLPQRSFADLEAQAVLVHDDRFRPPDGPRWASHGSWQASKQGYRWSRSNREDGSGAEDGGDGPEWLVYRHCSPHVPGEHAPVLDDYPMNQHVHRRLLSAADVWWSADVAAAEPATLWIALWRAPQAQALEPQALEIALPAGEGRLDAAWIDGRWRVRFAGGLRHASGGISSPSRAGVPVGLLAADAPIAVGFRGPGELRLRNVRLYRDLVYLDPLGRTADETFPRLAENRYFLVGDNVPLSIDSRHAPDGVPAEQIVGRIVPWPW